MKLKMKLKRAKGVIWCLALFASCSNPVNMDQEKNDVARLIVPATIVVESIEPFSIAIEGADNGVIMHLGWDTTRVAVPFTK